MAPFLFLSCMVCYFCARTRWGVAVMIICFLKSAFSSVPHEYMFAVSVRQKKPCCDPAVFSGACLISSESTLRRIPLGAIAGAGARARGVGDGRAKSAYPKSLGFGINRLHFFFVVYFARVFGFGSVSRILSPHTGSCGWRETLCFSFFFLQLRVVAVVATVCELLVGEHGF